MIVQDAVYCLHFSIVYFLCSTTALYKTFFFISLLPASGLESSDRWCAGSPCNRKAQASDFPEDHRDPHAGADPRRHCVFAGTA